MNFDDELSLEEEYIEECRALLAHYNTCTEPDYCKVCAEY